MGAICVTVDNLGEAAELGAGTWPAGAPLGRHFTVDVVARMLDLLDRHAVAATFFVEALNAELYPDLLRAIVARGHEVAVHGWQHERWSALDPARERALLARCTDALRAIGLRPVGFRPPGGQLTARTPGLLAELGYRFASPAGTRAGVAGALATIPFAWANVDAFYYAPSFAGLRARHGAPRAPLPPDALRDGFTRALEDGAAGAAPTTLIFHPLLLDDPARLAALDAVLARARELPGPCPTVGALVERMLAAPERQSAPRVDVTSWAG